MRELIRCVAGLDVHAKTVEVCVRASDPEGEEHQWVRRFGTMTEDLRRLSDWLCSKRVTHVAMESTGVYSKPVFNILEERFEGAAVQCMPPQARTGAQKRPARLPVDCPLAAVRVVEGQFHPAPGSP